MKRKKKLTRKQRQIAHRASLDLAAQKPRKHRKIKPIFSLTKYLEINAYKKHAKKHFREHRREHRREEKAEASK